MHVFTKQQAVEGASRNWKRQYFNEKSGTWYDDKKRAIYEQLIALSPPTAQSVDAAIGNGSWTRLTCDQCKREVDAYIEVGETPDYESRTADLCFNCLRQAAALVEETVKHE